jgi:hypothetical protein
MDDGKREYLVIGIRRNTKSKRICETGVSFASFDKKSFVAEFL